jgi:uncharacterized membrane protein YphA (DoxX/SURF4 family)
MKHVRTIAGILLGLCFLAASIPFLFHLMKMPKLPEGPVAQYMELMGSTGYMTFVKVFELIGGILVMIPRLRNIGLLILGPILVNILATTQFINGGGQAYANPMLILVVACALFLLWSARAKFAALLN